MMSDAAARNSYVATHPEAVALRAENEALREELAKLITDRDYLTTTVLPTIKAEYNLKIGGLEYEAFMLECRVRRGRRRLELAQSYLNRNERIPLASIESTLNDEFRRWQAKIEEMRRGLEAAQAFECALCLSTTETRELQTLYRQLTKRLHPDLNPHQNSARLVCCSTVSLRPLTRTKRKRPYLTLCGVGAMNCARTPSALSRIWRTSRLRRLIPYGRS